MTQVLTAISLSLWSLRREHETDARRRHTERWENWASQTGGCIQEIALLPFWTTANAGTQGQKWTGRLEVRRLRGSPEALHASAEAFRSKL